jgi:hypothetical protein
MVIRLVAALSDRRVPAEVPLVEWPTSSFSSAMKTFGHVWPVLGWTIHIYHSHLDVHPPIQVPMPFRFN